jgi:hypothetical protein
LCEVHKMRVRGRERGERERERGERRERYEESKSD